MWSFPGRGSAQYGSDEADLPIQMGSLSLAISSPFLPAISGMTMPSTSTSLDQSQAASVSSLNHAGTFLHPETSPAPRLLLHRGFGSSEGTSMARRESHGECREVSAEEEVVRRRRMARKPTAGARTVMAASGGEAGKQTIRSLLSDMVKGRGRIAPLVWLGLCMLVGYSRRNKKARAEGKSVLSETDDFGESLVAAEGQKKVLILMSDTGGGHRASAEAIKQAIEEEFGDSYKVTVIDLWKEHTPWPFNQMPKSYSFLVKHETLWKVAFHVTKPRFVHQSQMAATSAFVAREVAKGLNKYQPDVIVSVHPLMQHIPIRVLRSKGLLHKIPFTTVITDLTTCHPTWFHKLATMCFCPTKDVAERAFKVGLKGNQIKVHGLPIRPAFCKPVAAKDELRRELGMDPDLPAVLLMGGGEGMGPVEATARALARSLGGPEPCGQLIVICGRNKKLQGTLQAVDWPMPVQIRGFVTNMPEWMAACDCVISKAGPGTIAESMIRGLPMILNDFIAGQEVGNVPFVVDNGAGKFSEDPKEIAQIVAEWFGPKKDELQEMSANALKLARPDAVFRIVRDLDQLARRRDTLPQGELALTSE